MLMPAGTVPFDRGAPACVDQDFLACVDQDFLACVDQDFLGNDRI